MTRQSSGEDATGPGVALSGWQDVEVPQGAPELDVERTDPRVEVLDLRSTLVSTLRPSVCGVRPVQPTRWTALDWALLALAAGSGLLALAMALLSR